MEPAKKILTLCFAGKREHENLGHLQEALKKLFGYFDDFFSNTHFRLVTGLADGADQIAADTFTMQQASWGAEKSSNTFSMGAVMAFAKEDYLKTINEKEKFERLYKDDLCPQKLHLDGIYDEDETSKRERAHSQQGKMLVRLADVLIAVSVATDSPISGSTIQTVERALGAGKPVIFYDLEREEFFFYCNKDEWEYDMVSTSVDLSAIVSKIKDSKMDPVKRTREKNDEDYLNPDFIIPKRDLYFNLRNASLLIYRRLLNEKEERNKINEPKHDENDFIASEQFRISDISSYFQIQYRGGYTLNYMLAMLAVFIAILAFGYFTLTQMNMADYYWPLVVLGVIKAIIIFLINKNTKEVNSKNYNKKAIGYRYAAERLRANRYLSFIGVVNTIKPSLGKHTQTYLSAYPGEVLYEELLNTITVKTKYDITLDKEKILRDSATIKKNWIKGQIRYHEIEQKKMEMRHKKTEINTERFGVWVIGLVFIEILITIVEISFHETIEHLSGLLHVSSLMLLGVTVFLPAVVITLISINFQTEAKRLAFRSEMVKDEIENILDGLEEEEERLTDINRASEGCILMNLLPHFDRMGTVMTDEVAEWSMLYENKLYEAG